MQSRDRDWAQSTLSNLIERCVAGICDLSTCALAFDQVQHDHVGTELPESVFDAFESAIHHLPLARLQFGGRKGLASVLRGDR